MLVKVRTIQYELCDVFAETPFTGNQLAVFMEAAGISEEMLQRLAREINYSETSFVFPARGAGDGRLRIFTPLEELPFAGHPVLGAAFVVALSRNSSIATLETGAGEISVAFQTISKDGGFGCMNHPAPEPETYEHQAELFAALGLVRSALPVERYWNGATHVMVALSSAREVGSLRPNLAALSALRVCVSCFAPDGPVWKTRVFSPYDGVPEDPATGSAAGPLVCHLVRHGWISRADRITINQGAEIGRPSRLLARLNENQEAGAQVELCGSVISVGRGVLRLSL